MYLGHIGTELANALELRRKTEVLEFIFFDQSTTFQENIDLDRTLTKTLSYLKLKQLVYNTNKSSWDTFIVFIIFLKLVIIIERERSVAILIKQLLNISDWDF